MFHPWFPAGIRRISAIVPFLLSYTCYINMTFPIVLCVLHHIFRSHSLPIAVPCTAKRHITNTSMRSLICSHRAERVDLVCMSISKRNSSYTLAKRLRMPSQMDRNGTELKSIISTEMNRAEAANKEK